MKINLIELVKHNYNLSSRTLQKRYGIILILGWAMLISGTVFSVVLKVWEISFNADFSSILGITYVVVFGTVIPFLIYLTGSKHIGPQRASILGLIEPVASTLIAVMFMGESFKIIDYLGIAMILGASTLLTIPGE